MPNHAAILSDAFATLRRDKLRSLLVALGIAVGVAVLVGASVVVDQLEVRFMATVEQLLGSDGVIVAARGAMGGGPGAAAHNLTLADAEALPREVDGLILADTVQVLNDATVRYRDRGATARVFGNGEHADAAWSRPAINGEKINKRDVTEAARVALVGTVAARRLFGAEEPIGREITVNGAPFTVKGVLRSIGVDGHGTDRDDEIQIPITTLMRRVMNVDYLSMVKYKVGDGLSAEALGEKTRDALRRRHAIGAGEQDDFAVLTPKAMRDLIDRGAGVLRVLVPVVAGVCLLVAGLIVFNITMASVRERVREIGLRRAVGARPIDIGARFLAEAAMVSVLGGAVGIGLAQALIYAFSVKFAAPMVFSLPAILMGVGVTAVVALVSGFLPAMRAARLDPVAALRDE